MRDPSAMNMPPTEPSLKNSNYKGTHFSLDTQRKPNFITFFIINQPNYEYQEKSARHDSLFTRGCSYLCAELHEA